MGLAPGVADEPVPLGVAGVPVALDFVALGFVVLGLVLLGLVELGPVLGPADPDGLAVGLGSEVGVSEGLGALLARAVSH